MAKELAGVKIVSLTRLRNTANGNPRWLVQLDDGTSAPTWPDADCAFGIENSEYQDVPLMAALEKGMITRLRVEDQPQPRGRRR